MTNTRQLLKCYTILILIIYAKVFNDVFHLHDVLHCDDRHYEDHDVLHCDARHGEDHDVLHCDARHGDHDVEDGDYDDRDERDDVNDENPLCKL